MSTTSNVPKQDAPAYPETAPMAADNTKRADSTDRQSRSLVKDLPPGAPKPANAK